MFAIYHFETKGYCENRRRIVFHTDLFPKRRIFRGKHYIFDFLAVTLERLSEYSKVLGKRVANVKLLTANWKLDLEWGIVSGLWCLPFTRARCCLGLGRWPFRRWFRFNRSSPVNMEQDAVYKLVSTTVVNIGRSKILLLDKIAKNVYTVRYLTLRYSVFSITECLILEALYPSNSSSTSCCLRFDAMIKIIR